MRNLKYIYVAVISLMLVTCCFADEWDDLAKAAEDQRPSRTKRKTKSGQRLLREKAARIRAIQLEVPMLLDKGDYERAQVILKEALRLTMEMYEREDINVAESYLSLGIFYLKTGDSQKAVEVLSRAREIGEAVLGEGDFQLANIYRFLAAAYFDRGNYVKSEENATLLFSASVDEFGAKSSQAQYAKGLLQKIYAQE